MKTLKNLSVILLVVSFITLFFSTSYMLITEHKSEIYLYIIELSFLFVIISLGAILLLEENTKTV